MTKKKVIEKKEAASEEYPGVRFDPDLEKWIATCPKNGMVCVSTNDTFEQARSAMIKFEQDK